jgi:K+ transporter
MNASRPRTRSLVGPLVLITIGSLFLIQNLAQVNVFRIFKTLLPYWPVLLIVLGISKLVEYFRGKNSAG